VLYAIKALFFGGSHERTIFDQRRRRIAMKCIESEDVHLVLLLDTFAATPQHIAVSLWLTVAA
jgi:hypothetical protein